MVIHDKLMGSASKTALLKMISEKAAFMYQITLEWLVLRQNVSQTISSNTETKVKDAVRIGRDETRCDVVLRHPDTTIESTVSGLHVELFCDPHYGSICLRNLTQNRQPLKLPNPAVVDGYKVIHQEVPIRQGSQIQLGKMMLNVKTLEIDSVQLNSRYAIRCGNVKEPHFWPQDYSKLTCEICGCTMSGITIILN